MLLIRPQITKGRKTGKGIDPNFFDCMLVWRVLWGWRSEPANYVTNNSEREEDFTIAVRRTPAGLRALIGRSFQRIEIAVLRVAAAVAVPAMAPCVSPLAGGTCV